MDDQFGGNSSSRDACREVNGWERGNKVSIIRAHKKVSVFTATKIRAFVSPICKGCSTATKGPLWGSIEKTSNVFTQVPPVHNPARQNDRLTPKDMAMTHSPYQRKISPLGSMHSCWILGWHMSMLDMGSLRTHREKIQHTGWPMLRRLPSLSLNQDPFSLTPLLG
jgi:hypothetical protein